MLSYSKDPHNVEMLLAETYPEKSIYSSYNQNLCWEHQILNCLLIEVVPIVVKFYPQKQS